MKNFHRLIIACLICSLFLGYACLPVKVEASAAAASIAVSAAGSTAYVSPYIALGMILLLACGYVIETLPGFIDDTKAWVNSVPGLLDFLKAEAAAGVTSMAALKLVPTVKTAVEKKSEELEKPAPKKDIIYLPPDFHQLDRLSQAQLTGEDIGAALSTGNWLAQRTRNLISTLLGTTQDFKYNVETVLSHIPESLTSLRTQMGEKLSDLKTSMQTLRVNLVDGFGEVSTILSAYRAEINNKISSMTDTLSSRMLDVKSATSALRTQFVTQIDQVQDLMASAIRVTSNISTTLSNFAAGTYDDIKVALSGFRSQVEVSLADIRTAIGNSNVLLKEKLATSVVNMQTSLDSISQSVSNSVSFGNAGTGNSSVNINGGLGWFGSSSQVLSKYGVGLLAAGAILKEFTDIDYFSSLITISLSIGLVGVFFGIMMNVAQSDGSKSSKNNYISSSHVRSGG